MKRQFFARVSGRHVGNNPVARAIARAKLASMLSDLKIYLYLADNGDKSEQTMETITGIGTMLAVVGHAAESDPKIDPDDPRVMLLRGGLSACRQCLEAGKWDSRNTVAVESALDAAESLNKDLKPDYINQSWHKLVGTRL
jgi:hypothetical protein